MFKLRIVFLENGNCRIQKRHIFKTLGIWVTLLNTRGNYFETSEKRCREFISDYYSNNAPKKVTKYEEV